MKESQKNKPWSPLDERKLEQLAAGNTPTRVIALKLGDGVRAKAQELDVSLKPVNQKPYGTSKGK